MRTTIAALGKSQPFVSSQLRWLRLAGFVTSEHRGKYVVYRLVPKAIRAPLREVEELIQGKG